jgi:hypothetical protein
VADEFNARQPERNPITHSAVGQLVKTFKETGSVVDRPRVGRPSVGEDIGSGVTAKFHAHSHWFQIFRTLCTSSISTTTAPVNKSTEAVWPFEKALYSLRRVSECSA